MSSYYNENDPFAAEWLRNLIKEGHIADGEVDERSIQDVEPVDLLGFGQCHFFAGIGVWSHALRRAGWADDRSVWTGSCPCQPFSAAGKGGGFDDERHLWPAFFHLIEECRPGVVFGEQVASKDGLAWLDLVQADMEGTFYAFGALDLCAAGFGAPHIRQRLYWMAHNNNQRFDGRRPGETCDGRDAAWFEPERLRDAVELGHSDDSGSRRDTGTVPGAQGGAERSLRRVADGVEPSGATVELGVADGRRRAPGQPAAEATGHGDPAFATSGRNAAGPTNGLWRDADWLLCRDGKWRPVRPGSFPLAHGAASRVGRLRAYGNAIVAAQAEEFIVATTEALALS